MTERPYKNIERKYLLILSDVYMTQMRKCSMYENEKESEQWFYLFSLVIDELKTRQEEEQLSKKQITIEEYMRGRKNEWLLLWQK